MKIQPGELKNNQAAPALAVLPGPMADIDPRLGRLTLSLCATGLRGGRWWWAVSLKVVSMTRQFEAYWPPVSRAATAHRPSCYQSTW